MKNYICIDVGGTSIKYGVIDEKGRLFAKDEIFTEASKGGRGIVDKVKKIIRNCLEKRAVSGVCISTAGMVNDKTGEILYSSPLIPGYAGVNYKKIIESEFLLSCEVENDVNCAGLAESISGAGRSAKSCLCMTVGTGIGGCLVLDKKIFRGFSNSACEVGYMLMDGQEYQDIGSSKALVSKAEEQKGLERGSLNGKIIFEQAKAGDEISIRIIDEMAEILGKGIANICYVVNPEVVILGGGVMEQREYLYDRIRRSMDKYLKPVIAKETTLRFAHYRNEAGMLGAFYHFREKRNI